MPATTKPRSSWLCFPQQMRGFGHIKHRHVKHAKKRQAELLENSEVKLNQATSG